MQFGVNKNIRRIIRAKGLRQKDVAEKVGLTKQTFSKICQCERHVYADEVLPIATALQCSIEDLFREVSA